MDEFYNNITISEDLSAESEILERNLLALRRPADKPSELSSDHLSRNLSKKTLHALADYQMQLMLLERQNKRRLQIARLEQDSIQLDNHSVVTDDKHTALPDPRGFTSREVARTTEKAIVLDHRMMEEAL